VERHGGSRRAEGGIAMKFHGVFRSPKATST
jgi:hypothetical protein